MVIFTCDKQLTFNRRAFICWLALGYIRKKTTRPIFTKFGGKLAYGRRKKRQDFGGNRDHVFIYCRVRTGGWFVNDREASLTP